ncbi:MAG: TolC family protein [Deltaproteobacteria bacterium]|nr:TolC family protein [Deltaproteobacteria bacterium]
MNRIHRILGVFCICIISFFLAAVLAPSSLLGDQSQKTGSSALDLPVPFYHTYNLTSLFPVGLSGAEAHQSDVAGHGSVMTLDACIDAALAQNPNFNKSRENLRAAMGDILMAWGNYIPTLRASYGMSQNNRTSSYVDPSGVLRTAGGISKSSYGSLSMNLTIFNAAHHYFEMKNAHFFRHERQYQLSSAELLLVDQVRRAYFAALRQQQQLLAAENRAESLRDQLRLAEAKFSVGSVTKLDVLQAQVDLKDQELVIIENENALKNAKIELNRLMGTELERDFDLVDEFTIKKVELDQERLVKEAIENHPEVSALRYQIKQRKNDLWMGRLAYLPTVSTSLRYDRSEDGLEFFPNLNKGRGLSFNISWNIWDSFSRFRQNRYTEIQLNNLQYELAAKQLDIESQVRQYYLDLLRLHQRNLALRENRTLRQQSLELEQERYRLGAASILELRQAQVDFAQSEIDYINSIYDFHSTLSSLSRSIGRDLARELGM